MSTVLILGGAAASGHGRDESYRAVAQIKARGSRVILTDTAAALAAMPELAAMADRTGVLDYQDPMACADWALDHQRRQPVDAVLGFREYSVVAVAEVAAALGLRGNSPQSVRTARTKDACRQVLRAAGFAQPATALCASAEEIAAFLRLQGRPVIVKPRDASGSEGVVLVEHAAQAASALATARRGAADGVVLAEEFIEGPEFSVEGLFTEGRPQVLAVTRKLLARGTFVELGHALPVRLEDPQQDEIEAEVTRSLASLRLTSGVFHVECWLTSAGPVLGEIHVRPGGDWLHAMLEWSWPGLELFGCWHDDLLGLPVMLPEGPRRGAAVRYLDPAPGVIVGIEGWDAIAARPDVIAAELTLAPGDMVGAARASADRTGMVCVGGPDSESAERMVAELVASIKIRTKRAGA